MSEVKILCTVYKIDLYQTVRQKLFLFLWQEASEDNYLLTDSEIGHQQRIDFRKVETSRRKRGAWGRKHAATVEATAYRIVRNFAMSLH